jgi:uncharacterized lipoprotein YbaY/heat shock protein HslJ/uncharacterized lipoprotein NlpE involved in copper resistance
MNMNMRGAMQAVLSVLLLATGCSTAGKAELTGTVRGEASYRERIAVPSGTQLEVLLLDVSRADAPAEVIGKTIVADAGQPPYRFEIHYPPGRIIASHRYAVSARLSHAGRLLFATNQHYPVLTDGPPTEVRLLMKLAGSPEEKVVDGVLGALPATFTGDLPCADCEAIAYHLDLFADRTFHLRMTYRGKPGGAFDDIGRWAFSPDGRMLVLQGGRAAPGRFSVEGAEALRMMSQDGKPIVSELNYTLRRAPGFAPIEPRLMMRGLYSYMADAAMFTECLSGRRMPVAMEGDHRALEAAYTRTRREPGEALLVTLEGRILQRMPMEGPGPVPTLLPEKFVGIWPDETCGDRVAPVALLNTYWKLMQLSGAAVERFNHQREAHLVLHDDNRLAGADGCNQILGSYRIEGDTIAFSQIASTMMACLQGMEQARRFTAALGSVARYRIVGRHLELLDGEGAIQARFEAAAPR